MRRTVCCDIDGTLTTNSLPGGSYPWMGKFLWRVIRHLGLAKKLMRMSKPNWAMISEINSWANALRTQVVIITAREPVYRELTEAWLKHYGVVYAELKMKPEGQDVVLFKACASSAAAGCILLYEDQEFVREGIGTLLGPYAPDMRPPVVGHHRVKEGVGK